MNDTNTKAAAPQPDEFALKRFPNGGWGIYSAVGVQYGCGHTPIAAFSNTSDMILGLRSLLK